ncbi:hypothetical protein H5410_008103 [Solanum commersonii]|uniref:Uncharacterized protein n=1 Tax=Solanum commersonii TaxID=4109 RepID=A0A9J6ADZ5_SOLCO|nr:hypothetical protein H5410_008103 [Solanum commersonii]
MLKFLQSVVPLSQRIKRRKKNEAKKRVSPTNQKEKKRKEKIVEIPFDSNYDFKLFNLQNHQQEEQQKRRNQKSQYPKKAKKLLGCTHVYLLNTSVMKFLICVLLISMQSTINDDGAISESEVTDTVARKFGGSRIAKEHAPDTSNYPTPRPRRLNLR